LLRAHIRRREPIRWIEINHQVEIRGEPRNTTRVHRHPARNTIARRRTFLRLLDPDLPKPERGYQRRQRAMVIRWACSRWMTTELPMPLSADAINP
jgi:hypothetical protein